MCENTQLDKASKFERFRPRPSTQAELSEEAPGQLDVAQSRGPALGLREQVWWRLLGMAQRCKTQERKPEAPSRTSIDLRQGLIVGALLAGASELLRLGGSSAIRPQGKP